MPPSSKMLPRASCTVLYGSLLALASPPLTGNLVLDGPQPASRAPSVTSARLRPVLPSMLMDGRPCLRSPELWPPAEGFGEPAGDRRARPAPLGTGEHATPLVQRTLAQMHYLGLGIQGEPAALDAVEGQDLAEVVLGCQTKLLKGEA